MGDARVVEILIAESPSHPMAAVSEAFAIAGRGLEGDRYFLNTGTFSPHPQKPDFEITFIEKECIEQFSKESGLPFSSADARRNVVTEGVRLNELVGFTFSLGDLVIHGIRLCEPCSYLAKKTFPEVLRGLVHRGGLRAQIVQGGRLRVGDLIHLKGASR